jgi:hypothetical protein
MYRSSVLALFMCASATAFLAPRQAAVGAQRNLNVYLLHDFAPREHLTSIPFFISFDASQQEQVSKPSP